MQKLYIALFPGHSQILSPSCGENLSPQLQLSMETCLRILSHSCGENFPPRLRDKIWEWPGNKANPTGYTLQVGEKTTIAIGW